MTLRAALALPLLVATAHGARAEKLVVSLSTHRIAVTSNFEGEDLVLFGSIEQDARSVARPAGYDLVVTVTGPRETYRTRRRERVFGIWANVESREFVNVPSYLAVLTSRPLRDIASAETQRKMQLGIDSFLLTQQIGPDLGDTVPDDPFRVAFVKLRQQQSLYTENADAVSFLTPTVFRAAIPVPSTAPVGTYAVDVQLFSGGTAVASAGAALDISKAGIEQFLVDAARNHGVLYGLATMMMALLTGWFASVVFRRD